MRVLYISNIEVPYRVAFFNKLAERCDLTVLYERRKSSNRDAEWVQSSQKRCKAFYLDGLNIGNEYSFSFGILKWIFGGYDEIIVGCYNSKVEIFAIFVMRLLKISYILSNDGEILKNRGIKYQIKKFIMKGAKAYATAGEVSAASIRAMFPAKPVFSYQFSSLTKGEIENNSHKVLTREDFILVIGQFFDYKGMDVALRVARKNRSIKYKFVGMGKRTELFINSYSAQSEPNVEFVPFLQKTELYEEYAKCKVLLLPTRGECWGLVVNEAASFGTPIVSTWGSGAAVDFLGKNYPEYLADPGDDESLYNTLMFALTHDMLDYSDYLIKKSKTYSIEEMVRIHADFLNKLNEDESSVDK